MATIQLPNGQTVTLGPSGGVLGGSRTPGSTIPGGVLPPLTPQQLAPSTVAPAATAGGDPTAWYEQLLANDPQLAAALAAISSQQSAYQGQAQTAEQQLLEAYGAVPSGLGDQFQSILSPTVTDLANQNTQAGTSTVAQLLKAFQNQQSGTLDSLAARGMLRSGATGYDQNQNLQGYNSAQYNALQSLLGNLGTQQSNLLQQEGTLNQQSEQATNDAYTRILQQIQAGTLVAPTTSAAAAPSTGAAAAPKPAPSPSVPAAPFNPKPPTPEVGGNPTVGYSLNPGVGGRAGVGVGGALNS